MGVYIKPFIADAQKLEKNTGIPASITLAQIMLESGGTYEGGLSGLAFRAKNLFGIKGEGTAGSYTSGTTEYIGGVPRLISGTFRKYNTYYESMVDHGELLQKERYAKQFSGAKTVDDFAIGLQNAGYATDPNYANKLIKLIEDNKLSSYDSGKYKFKGGSTYGKGGAGLTKKDLEAKDKSPDKRGLFNEMVYNIFHAVVVILVIGIGILFFMKAFNISTYSGGKSNE